MSTSRVELVHFPSCPNVDAARSNLRRALADAGRPPEWREWDVHDEDTPADRRRYPSPTVLVDGQPVEGGELDGEATGCRVGGAPSAEAIRRALDARR